MFHYDVVGFHTEEWKNAFNGYALYEAGGMQMSDGRVRAFGRTTLPRSFPIGIDAKSFADDYRVNMRVTAVTPAVQRLLQLTNVPDLAGEPIQHTA